MMFEILYQLSCQSSPQSWAPWTNHTLLFLMLIINFSAAACAILASWHDMRTLPQPIGFGILVVRF